MPIGKLMMAQWKVILAAIAIIFAFAMCHERDKAIAGAATFNGTREIMAGKIDSLSKSNQVLLQQRDSMVKVARTLAAKTPEVVKKVISSARPVLVVDTVFTPGNSIPKLDSSIVAMVPLDSVRPLIKHAEDEAATINSNLLKDEVVIGGLKKEIAGQKDLIHLQDDEIKRLNKHSKWVMVRSAVTGALILEGAIELLKAMR